MVWCRKGHKLILILTQTFAPGTGGMEMLMTGLADALARAGRKVSVLADRKPGDAAFVPAGHGYDLRRFGGPRPLRLWRKARAAVQLDAVARIEAVFCDSWKGAEALPRSLYGRTVVLAHGAEFPPAPGPRKTKRITAALSRVGSVVANSHFTAEAARRFLAEGARTQIHVVNPPVTPPPAPTENALASMRVQIADRAPVLCTLARLEPRKGIDRVIAAIPEIVMRHPAALFLIGGAGADRERLQTLAREKGVGDHVVFLGRLGEDEKAALLSNADLFVMPVRREGRSVEGFGLVYIEAAWFGVPALGGREGGAADAVIDGETGLLCNGSDQADVTMTLLRMLDDDDARCRMSAAAKARAWRDFTWAAVLPRYLAAAGISTR